MSDAGALLRRVRDLGVVLWAEDGRLRFRGPAGAVTPALREQMLALKPELLALVQAAPKQLALGAIEHVADADYYAPSDAQRRIWVLSQLGGEGVPYHIALHLLLDGPLDRIALEQALCRLVERHEVLRTRLKATDGVLRQHVAEPGAFHVGWVDLASGAEAEARALARGELQTPFDLEAGLPVRVTCARLGAQRHALLLTVHHIAADGWSLSVLLRELSQLYRAFQAGRADPLSPLRLQYRDFAAWQNRLLEGPAAALMRAHWLERLAGKTEPLELPTRLRPSRQSFRGDMLVVDLGSDRSAALRGLVLRHQASLFMGLCAVLTCLLHRYTGQPTIVVGTPVAGRDHPDLEGQVGHYLNTLVLLSVIDGRQSFAALLAGVKRTVLDALDHQTYPFNRLVDELARDRDPARNPVFDVMISLQNAGRIDLILPGVTTSSLFIEPGTSKLDLTFDFEDGTDGLVLGIRYNTDLFDSGRIAAMADHFRRLLDGLLADEDKPVGALEMLTSEEHRRVVVEVNRTAADYSCEATLIELFARQAAASPDDVALVYGDERLTYGELARRSQQIANLLDATGQHRDAPVGVLVERSAGLPAAVLGVLRAGVPYLPLDVGHPAARLVAIIRAAGCKVVLTHGAPALPELDGVTLIPIGQPQAERAGQSGPRHSEELPSATRPREGRAMARPDDPAYVIFTSGTTSEPKGVVVTHRNVVAFLSAMAAGPGCGPGETFLSVTTPSFDIFGLELFLPLTSGGRLVIAERDDIADGSRLNALIEREGVTMMQATPAAVWRLLCETGWPGDGRLTMLCGGEALAPTLAADLLARGGTLWNLYGPTETTIWSCAALLTSADLPVPIGRPIANTRVFVLDPALRPLPPGITGEIWIAGAGLARGYLNAPGLTAQRFIPDPFGNSGRLYRTGDLGRWLPDGQLEYLGRGDGQIKIRGHRIEVAEIEHRLRLLPSVRDAAVGARPGPSGQAELCAWLTGEPDVAQVQAALRAVLPPAMVPNHYIVLRKLPLNPSGKVDRDALPAPASSSGSAPPRDPAERSLAGIWARELGAGAVGGNDNFFDLGGHSLTAMVLAGRIRRAMGVDCTLADIFEAPTVAALAARLRARAPARFLPIHRVPEAPQYQASHAQRRLWVASQARQASIAYSMMQSVLIEDSPAAPALDAAVLETALRRLIERHESLRTTFQAKDDTLWQIVHPSEVAKRFVLSRIDLAAEPVPVEAARRLVTAEAATSFNLAAGPLLRAALMRLGQGRYVLMVNMHHIVADAWSLRVMAREIGRDYALLRLGCAEPVVPPAIQYRDIAAWQDALLAQGLLGSQRSYWLAKLAGASPARLPTDRPRPVNPGFGGSAVTIRLPPEHVAALQGFGRRHRASLFGTLLTAVNALLYRYTAAEDIIVGCVTAGRTVPELEEQVGFFVNTLPLRNRIGAIATWTSLLMDVARTATEAFAHQDYPFDRLIAELHERGPLFDVVVDYHEDDESDEAEAFGGLRTSSFAVRPPFAKFDLLFLFLRDRNGLRVTLEYATDLFAPSRIEEMADHFRQVLDAALTDPARPIIELPLTGPMGGPMGGPMAPRAAAAADALEQFDFAEERL